MNKEKLTQLRNDLIQLRNECLGQTMDSDGAILLSHTISYLYAKINDIPFIFNRD
jgi:hypothetical protein